MRHAFDDLRNMHLRPVRTDTKCCGADTGPRDGKTRALIRLRVPGLRFAAPGMTDLHSLPSTQPLTVGFLLIPGFALMSYAAAVEPLRAANQSSGKDPVPLVARRAGQGTGRRLERRRDRPRLSARRGERRRHRLRLRRRQPGHLRRSRHLRLAPPARPAGRHHRRHLRRALCARRAGLLDGRRATLHWEHAAAFHEAFPDVDVVRRSSSSTATASPARAASRRST